MFSILPGEHVLLRSQLLERLLLGTPLFGFTSYFLYFHLPTYLERIPPIQASSSSSANQVSVNAMVSGKWDVFRFWNDSVNPGSGEWISLVDYVTAYCKLTAASGLKVSDNGHLSPPATVTETRIKTRSHGTKLPPISEAMRWMSQEGSLNMRNSEFKYQA
ncbi:uncharacterized protein BJX67DRAFT_33539 [Aspergillus lucknowensis]|uniref:Uncharacterized protein n=1 Tax=Aspergillus lucknowensis TaxID=176173 RepID=A0ABR4L5X0_9EURO